MIFKGRITTLFERQSGVSAKGTDYTKQEFIVTGLQGMYPDQLLVAAIGEDAIAQLDGLVQGEIYDFEIDLRVSQGTSGRMFQNAKLYKVRQLGNSPNLNPAAGTAAQPASFNDGLPY